MEHLEIYTDASFNDNKEDFKYIGGVGIVCIVKNDADEIIDVTYSSFRFTREEIREICDYPDITIKNGFMEFYGVLYALRMFLPYGKEIHLYTDDLVSYRLFTEDIVSCNRLLRFRPNERFLFDNFIKDCSEYDFRVHISKIKGHSGIFYNSIADYLAKYWLDAETALKRAYSCENNDMLNLTKKHTNLERKAKRKGFVYPYDEYYENECKFIKRTLIEPIFNEF